MFTGLVEEIGAVNSSTKTRGGAVLGIKAEKVLEDLHIGDSIAVSGVCLTVVDFDDRGFAVDVTDETLQRSTLGDLPLPRAVNLERALRVDQRLGGHFVQGHVDGIGRVVALERRGQSPWLKVELSPELAVYTVEKGSIAIDGISLTIARSENRSVGISVIPQTFTVTTLATTKPGDRVNVEVDILAKYVRKYVHPDSGTGSISPEKLSLWGYE
jgi:riboflavin synthase